MGLDLEDLVEGHRGVRVLLLAVRRDAQVHQRHGADLGAGPGRLEQPLLHRPRAVRHAGRAQRLGEAPPRVHVRGILRDDPAEVTHGLGGPPGPLLHQRQVEEALLEQAGLIHGVRVLHRDGEVDDRAVGIALPRERRPDLGRRQRPRGLLLRPLGGREGLPVPLQRPGGIVRIEGEAPQAGEGLGLLVVEGRRGLEVRLGLGAPLLAQQFDPGLGQAGPGRAPELGDLLPAPRGERLGPVHRGIGRGDVPLVERDPAQPEPGLGRVALPVTLHGFHQDALRVAEDALAVAGALDGGLHVGAARAHLEVGAAQVARRRLVSRRLRRHHDLRDRPGPSRGLLRRGGHGDRHGARGTENPAHLHCSLVAVVSAPSRRRTASCTSLATSRGARPRRFAAATTSS